MKKYIIINILEVIDIKKILCLTTFIICIIILLSGCKKSEEKPNIDDKISAEIQYLDKEISGFIDIATGKNEKNYDVQKEKAKTGVSNKNTEDSNSRKFRRKFRRRFGTRFTRRFQSKFKKQ